MNAMNNLVVFPAHAGMSPLFVNECAAEAGFPRTRGDEPLIKDILGGAFKFSPHTRG